MNRAAKRFVASVVAVCALVGFAGPADAAEANASIYIVAPRWAGWCATKNNRPFYMMQWNATTGHRTADYGDDIIGSRVRLHTSNTIDVQVGCLTGHGSAGAKIKIRPTRHNQTFFVYPGGRTTNN